MNVEMENLFPPETILVNILYPSDSLSPKPGIGIQILFKPFSRNGKMHEKYYLMIISEVPLYKKNKIIPKFFDTWSYPLVYLLKW